MKPIEKIALDSLLLGILDSQAKIDSFIEEKVLRFSEEYEINDDFGMQDCAERLIEAAIQKVAEKFELSESEVYDALEALADEHQL